MKAKGRISWFHVNTTMGRSWRGARQDQDHAASMGTQPSEGHGSGCGSTAELLHLGGGDREVTATVGMALGRDRSGIVSEQ